jgi:hypothetical protein
MDYQQFQQSLSISLSSSDLPYSQVFMKIWKNVAYQGENVFDAMKYVGMISPGSLAFQVSFCTGVILK